MKKFINILLALTWELPQNILGLLTLIVSVLMNSKPKVYTKDGIKYFSPNWMWNGVSLGRFILIPKSVSEGNTFPRIEDTWTVGHEHGHQIQSRYLGPLYLFVIGIPSAIHNIWNSKLKNKVNKSTGKTWTFIERYEEYYSYWCEKWADKLGKVYDGRRSYIKNYKVAHNHKSK